MSVAAVCLAAVALAPSPAWRGSPRAARASRVVASAAAPATTLAARLDGLSLTRAADGAAVDLGSATGGGSDGSTLIVFGTYAADFNQIEYAQKVRHYLPELKAKGVSRILLIVNGGVAQCSALSDILDLPEEVELLSDPSGAAGRQFGVSQGWMPDEERLSPYVKLLGMLVGLGAGGTLPSVVAGYIGNPWGTSKWIEQSLAQGQRAGRWPGMALDLNPEGKVARNAFDELPVVSGWGRRPLELATLRLQNMVGISLANWNTLQPEDPRCLTQLGGCAVVGPNGAIQYEFIDNGICGTANFEDILSKL